MWACGRRFHREHHFSDLPLERMKILRGKRSSSRYRGPHDVSTLAWSVMYSLSVLSSCSGDNIFCHKEGETQKKKKSSGCVKSFWRCMATAAWAVYGFARAVEIGASVCVCVWGGSVDVCPLSWLNVCGFSPWVVGVVRAYRDDRFWSSVCLCWSHTWILFLAPGFSWEDDFLRLRDISDFSDWIWCTRAQILSESVLMTIFVL